MGARRLSRIAPHLSHAVDRCLLRIWTTLRPGFRCRCFTAKTLQLDKNSVDAEAFPSTGLPAELKFNDDTTDVSCRRNESILDLLEQRGVVNQIVGERDDLQRLITNKKVGVYVGVDPTAPSLHVGHLVPLMALYWMYSRGFPAYTVLGDATAKIGDPSGRTSARAAQSHADQTTNADKIHGQLSQLWIGAEHELTRHGLSADASIRQRKIVTNNSWLERTPMLDIMRQLLPGVRLGTMLGRDTVRTRMKKDGMSLAEFLYPIMQAWDFWHLYSEKGVQIQVGGSDQFGNILAGIDAINFIKKKNSELSSPQDLSTADPQQAWKAKAMGFTIPLLTTASGEKFGKSAGNAVWLDSEYTTPFDLYKFFLGTADNDVHKYLKLFTFESLESLDKLLESHDSQQSKRLAQHALALNVLRLVHGNETAEKARSDHDRLFSSSTGYITVPVSKEASEGTEDQVAPDNPSVNTTLPQSLVIRQPMASVLFHAGLVSSRSEGRRLCDANGAYFGARTGLDGDRKFQWRPVKDTDRNDAGTSVVDGNLLILRAGKTKVRIVTITSDEDFDARRLTAPGWQSNQSPKEDKSL